MVRKSRLGVSAQGVKKTDTFSAARASTAQRSTLEAQRWLTLWEVLGGWLGAEGE